GPASGHVVERVREGRADQLVEPLPRQANHASHLRHADDALGFALELDAHWTPFRSNQTAFGQRQVASRCSRPSAVSCRRPPSSFTTRPARIKKGSTTWLTVLAGSPKRLAITFSRPTPPATMPR